MIGWSRIGKILIRDGDHAKPVAVESRSLLLHLRKMAPVERRYIAVHRVMCACGKDLLDCAFADQQVLVFLGCQNNRHAPPRKVERQFINFFEAMLEPDMLLHLDMVEHGNVQQVLQPGLVVAVEIGVFEDAARFPTMQVDVMHQDDLVLGQRAGLVGAQDIHRPEVLDRVETLYDHLLARHRDGALRQIDGHDHRQHLGCQPDRHGEREHQRL